jgi:hypothetical protein
VDTDPISDAFLLFGIVLAFLVDLHIYLIWISIRYTYIWRERLVFSIRHL